MITKLNDAAPYIKQFQGSIFVVKIGGEILLDGARLDRLVRQVHVLWQVGVHPVLVHGAGPQLDAALRAVGHEPIKVAGRRITDAETLELAKQTFRGSANLALVTALQRAHLPAVGLSGVDAETLLVRRRAPVEIEGRTVDYGHVGDPVQVKPDLVLSLLEHDFAPAICSLGVDAEGAVLNVNADTVACELAVGLGAAKLMFVTDRPGILHDPDDPASIYSVLDAADVERLSEEGVISGGMVPKVAAGLEALRRGVERVHVVGGDESDPLLEETFTNQGCGTMLVLERSSRAP